MYNPSNWIWVGSPERQSGKTHAELGSAVEAVLKREKLASACVKRCQQGGPFVGLAAAAAEETSAKIAGQDPGKFLGQIHDGLGQIYSGRMLKSPDLATYRFDNLGMTMSKSMHTHA
jgi:hypothetical protein